jgi:hypothetical protein
VIILFADRFKAVPLLDQTQTPVLQNLSLITRDHKISDYFLHFSHPVVCRLPTCANKSEVVSLFQYGIFLMVSFKLNFQRRLPSSKKNLLPFCVIHYI